MALAASVPRLLEARTDRRTGTLTVAEARPEARARCNTRTLRPGVPPAACCHVYALDSPIQSPSVNAPVLVCAAFALLAACGNRAAVARANAICAATKTVAADRIQAADREPGNLVFQGRSDGVFAACAADTGALRWEMPVYTGEGELPVPEVTHVNIPQPPEVQVTEEEIAHGEALYQAHRRQRCDVEGRLTTGRGIGGAR